MKTRIRYDVRGMMEWHPEFKVGRTRVKIPFTGGHLCGGGCTPASFETEDPVLQKVIESSEAYRSRRIVRGLVMEGRDAGAPVARGGTHRHRMECATLTDAQEYLLRNKGVLIDDILDPASCISMAEKLGIELVIGKEQQS